MDKINPAPIPDSDELGQPDSDKKLAVAGTEPTASRLEGNHADLWVSSRPEQLNFKSN